MATPTWNEGLLPVSASWQAACWSGTKFYLFDDVTNGIVLVSPTGLPGSWTQIVITSIDHRAAAAFGLLGVAVTTSRDTTYTTDGGATWIRGVNKLPNAGNWVGIAHNGSRFVAVSDGAAVGSRAAYSDNANTWIGATLSTSVNWYSVAWTGTKFVAVGLHVSDGNAYSSSSANGTVWGAIVNMGPATDGSVFNPINVTAFGSVLIAVGYDALIATFQWVSTNDGVTWTGSTLIIDNASLDWVVSDPAQGIVTAGYPSIALSYEPDENGPWDTANDDFPSGLLYFACAAASPTGFIIPAYSSDIYIHTMGTVVLNPAFFPHTFMN